VIDTGRVSRKDPSHAQETRTCHRVDFMNFLLPASLCIFLLFVVSLILTLQCIANSAAPFCYTKKTPLLTQISTHRHISHQRNLRSLSSMETRSSPSLSVLLNLARAAHLDPASLHLTSKSLLFKRLKESTDFERLRRIQARSERKEERKKGKEEEARSVRLENDQARTQFSRASKRSSSNNCSNSRHSRKKTNGQSTLCREETDLARMEDGKEPRLRRKETFSQAPGPRRKKRICQDSQDKMVAEEGKGPEARGRVTAFAARRGRSHRDRSCTPALSSGPSLSTDRADTDIKRSLRSRHATGRYRHSSSLSPLTAAWSTSQARNLIPSPSPSSRPSHAAHPAPIEHDGGGKMSPAEKAAWEASIKSDPPRASLSPSPRSSPRPFLDPILLTALATPSSSSSAHRDPIFRYQRPNGSAVSYRVSSLVDYLLATGKFEEPETRLPFTGTTLLSLHISLLPSLPSFLPLALPPNPVLSSTLFHSIASEPRGESFTLIRSRGPFANPPRASHPSYPPPPYSLPPTHPLPSLWTASDADLKTLDSLARRAHLGRKSVWEAKYRGREQYTEMNFRRDALMGTREGGREGGRRERAMGKEKVGYVMRLEEKCATWLPSSLFPSRHPSRPGTLRGRVGD